MRKRGESGKEGKRERGKERKREKEKKKKRGGTGRVRVRGE